MALEAPGRGPAQLSDFCQVTLAGRGSDWPIAGVGLPVPSRMPPKQDAMLTRLSGGGLQGTGFFGEAACQWLRLT